MAYYLTAQVTRGKYVPIPITSSKYFSRLSKLKNEGATLEEVDHFTMIFDNEHELRSLLKKEGILPMRYTHSKLSIRRKENEIYKKVSYDFLYQKDLEYVMNPRLVIAKINDYLYNYDFRFILMFANKYLEYYDCKSTAPEVREFANSSIRMNQIDKHFYELDENGDNPLSRMAKLLIYEYNQSPNGRIEYKVTKKHRNLHSIIAFINNYDKKYINEIVNNQTSLFDEKQVKTLKRVKKPCIDGQLSIFEEKQ